MSAAPQRILGLPTWLAAIERLIVEASREVQTLSALSPIDARQERERLVAEVRRGRTAVPRWSYRARDHDALRRALDAAERVLSVACGAGVIGHPHEGLYLDRVRELSIEAALCAAAGTQAVARLAAVRFGPRDTENGRAASALCAAWLAEPPPAGRGDDAEAVRSDAPDPRSLLSQMTAEVGRLRLPFTVVATAALASLAATGERSIFVAAGRRVEDSDARRTVHHEIEGHARPRARSVRATSALFRAGTAGGMDDQEGFALLVEERGGFLSARRRRHLAARHHAVETMLDGAVFGEVVSDLMTKHGVVDEEAIIVAERVFRGGDGSHPGLGRERVYLEALLRVRSHLARRPEDDSVLASGQVAVGAIGVLRAFAPGPGDSTARRPEH